MKKNSIDSFIEYKKLESIHCAIQEALIKLPDDVELENALGFVEDIREKHFNKKDFMKWHNKMEWRLVNDRTN
jgi:hypothetical protein